MHFHWQNLRENGRKELVHGRAWLFFGLRGILGWSWFVGLGESARAEITAGGDEDDVSLSFAVWFFAFHFTICGLLPWTWLPRDEPRTTGVSLFEDHLSLRWNCADNEVRSVKLPNGRRRMVPRVGWYRSWFLLDVLLGRAHHAMQPIAEQDATVQMPEGAYPCMVRLHLDTWKRPRWPFARRLRRATVEIPAGVPMPGKGENAWDCGEDACYSSTSLAASVEEATEGVRSFVEGRRLRYGGEGWRPTRASSAAA